MSSQQLKNTSSESNHRHFPGLDTLRALAILMVIPRHAREVLGGEFVGPVLKPIFNAGWIGVDLFFVLSGFLIGSQLLQSVKRDGRIDFKRFYLKRTFRIMPSYFCVLAIYYLWPDFREKPEIDPAWRFVFYIMNYGRKGEAFSHAWSLCVEEHFYLVFPLVVAICAWKPKFFKPIVLIPGVLVGEVILRYYLWATGAAFYPAVYRPSHTHLDGLTIGVAIAAMKEYRSTYWDRIVTKPNLLFVLGFILLGFGIYENFPQPVSYVFSFSFVSIGFGLLVSSALAPNFWLSKHKIPGAATIAALAFTLYLTHKQMIHLATVLVGDYKEEKLATVALATLLVILAAYALHLGIEKPFLKLRDRILKTNRS